MTFNPLSITEELHLRYVDFFKSSFAGNNEELSQKLDNLSEGNLLWKSPFISITQNYQPGQTDRELANETSINADVLSAIHIPRFYTHQELAIKNIVSAGRNTIISSGTGSGKTESFLIPMLNECIKSDNTKGIKAVIIYPMNALANDQVDRIRNYLFRLNETRKAKSKREITFGIYTRQTPESPHSSKSYQQEDFSSLKTIDTRCPSCGQNSLHVDDDGINSFYSCRNEKGFRINYQIITRKELRENPPDIFITNYVMLEYLLLRKRDSVLFQNNKIKYLVLDELHSYAGARGVDVGLLMRRFRRRIQKNSKISGNVICIGTSATISRDKDALERKMKISDFTSKLFGVKFSPNDIFEGERIPWKLPPQENLNQLTTLEPPQNLEDLCDDDFRKFCRQIDSAYSNEQNLPHDRNKLVGKLLLKNQFFQYLIKSLSEPRSIEHLTKKILGNDQFVKLIPASQSNDSGISRLIWGYLYAGSLAHDPGSEKQDPLLRVNVHNFFRGIPRLFMCTNPECKRLYHFPRDICESCLRVVESLGVCRACGKEFLVSKVSQGELNKIGRKDERDEILAIGKDVNEPPRVKRYSLSEPINDESKLWFSFAIDTVDGPSIRGDHLLLKKCLKCGSFSPFDSKSCEFQVRGALCGSTNFVNVATFPRNTSTGGISFRPHDCPYCGSSYGAGYVITEFEMSPKQASVNLFNMIYDYLPNQKLLIFTDNRQDAASLAGWLDFAHDDTALKQLMIKKLQKISKERPYCSYREFIDDELIPYIKAEWYNHSLEDFDRSPEEIIRLIQTELISGTKLSLEWQGLLEFNYQGLVDQQDFSQRWKNHCSTHKFSLIPSEKVEQITNSNDAKIMDTLVRFIITTLNLMRRDGALFGLHQRYYYERSRAEGFIFDINRDKAEQTRGTKVNPINSKRLKFLKYTKKVFQLSNDEVVSLIDAIWHFLVKEGYIVKVALARGRFKQQQPILAYVVSTDKIRLGLPREIQQCPKCLKIYSHLPDNNCPTIIRQKTCTGITNQITFEEFRNTNNSHFFKLFSEGEPSRMVTKEDTGALDQYDRKRIQNDFGGETQDKRKVDVIVATPTLELGVDIGDLSSIGLYKSPPSPVSYLQRIGRAGRRDGISFINTFFFDSPIDEFYYRNPQDLINGVVNPPYLNFDSVKINNHINSLIFEEIFTSEDKESTYPLYVSEFVKDRKSNTAKMMSEAEAKKAIIAEKMKYVLNNIEEYAKEYEATDQFIDDYLRKNFRKAIDESLDYFEDEISACKKGIAEFDKRGSSSSLSDRWKLKELTELSLKLQEKRLIDHFFDTNVLPRYAFPGKVVAIEDLGGTRFEGRSRNIAISEFAPGCEVTLKKRIYRSVGIDMDERTIKYFYVCSNCRKYFKNENWENQPCPFCQIVAKPDSIRSISPKKIYLREVSRSVTDHLKYTEPYVEVFLPSNHIEDTRPIELPSFKIELTKYGPVRMLETVGQVFTEKDDELEEDGIDRDSSDILICNECGKVKERIGDRPHRRLTDKFSKRFDCKGEFDHLTIHHEMPTNMISIKVATKNMEGFENVKSRRFLTTLKNAIIFAGQPIVEAEDGEIDGQIKDKEIMLFDNVDGGTGYVNIIYEKLEEILKRAYYIINEESTTYGEECDTGCMRCLWSFRRKRDIPYINKQLILPLLSEAYLNPTSTSSQKEKADIRNTGKLEHVQSSSLSFSAANKIRNLIRKTESELVIYSPRFSPESLDWEEEGPKSWLDILGSIKNSEKNLKITIYSKKPDNFADESALLKLSTYGIEIFEVSNNGAFDDRSILEGSLIVIDPFLREKRTSIQSSSSLTEQIWKNSTTVLISHDEKVVKDSLGKIEIIRQNSSQNKTLLGKFGAYKVIIIRPSDKNSLQLAVQELTKILKNAKNEVKIADAYLGNKERPSRENIEWYLRKICEFLPENVSIKVVTCDQNRTEISNLAISLSLSGHKTEIISFNAVYPKPKPIHKRFVIVDDSIAVDLDKGLRLLFDYEIHHNAGGLTDIKITDEKSMVQDRITTFNEYWNYDNSLDEEIKNCPKFDTRRPER